MFAQTARWVIGVTIAAVIITAPLVYYRASYAHAKRLREVTASKFYRSGQLTAQGFRDAFERYQIRTVINLQNEAPDPLMPETFLDEPTVRESELCAEHGVHYIFLHPDLLPPDSPHDQQPQVVQEFLKVTDDPDAYPILLHCKAGLHRTGLLTAIYRMEYEAWSLSAAVRELDANGFGKNCHTGNEYLIQYLERYRPRERSD